MNKTISAAVLLGLPCAHIHAQDLPDLEEIIVSATRLDESLLTATRSLSVIEETQIQTATQQLGIDEVLAAVPGLYIQGRYNFSQDLRVALRGFGARSSFGIRGIRIYVDDVPESLPDGQAQVDSIDMGSASRIEVIRGPSSSLYGNASGGVISITSQRGELPPELETTLSLGEYGYGRYQIKLNGQAGSTDYLLNVSRTELDGYRDHAEARGNLFNGRVNVALGNSSTLRVVASVTDQPTSLDPGGINAAQVELDRRSARDRNIQFNSGEELFQSKLGFAYEKEGDDSRLLIRGYVVDRDFDNFLPFQGGGSVNLERLYTGVGLQYTGKINQSLQYTVGFDLDRQDDDRIRFDNVSGVRGDITLDQNEKVSSLGGFAQGTYSPSEDWLIRLGLRLDRVEFDVSDRFLVDGQDSGDVSFTETSPSLSFSRRVGDGHRLFASVGRSFETPTTTEFADPNGGGGFNQSLESQESLAYELGLRGNHLAFQYEVVAFNIDLQNELIPFELDSMPGRTFFSNAGESTRTGLEVAASWSGSAGLFAQASYTLTDFEFDDFVDGNGNDFSGNRLPGLPRNYGYASVGYESESGLFLTLEGIYAGSLFANNGNTVEVDSYFVSNLRLAHSWTFDRVDLQPYIGVNNLFGEKYNNNIRINAFGSRFFEPAPERNAYFGVKVSYRLKR
ncbi:MAG: TonB-dependent receptor [Pseudomonadota bacterium]